MQNTKYSMKVWKIYSISLLVVLWFTTSCNRKCKELSTLAFSSKNKEVLPYHGNERLIISVSQGFNDSLQGSGRLDQFNHINSNSSSVTDNQDCNGDYYEVEYNRIVFTSMTNLSAVQLAFSLEFNNPFKVSGTHKYLNIAYGATYEPHDGFFKNKYLIENDSILTNDSSVFFHPSISIGSTQFDSVYELHGYHTFYNYVDIIYYTIKQGIIATKDYEGTIWYFTKRD